MKTIKQIADEIGVSKQAVHQKRKNKILSTALQPFTSIVDGVVYIAHDGEMLLKDAFQKNGCKHIDNNEPSTHLHSIDGEVVKLLQDNVAVLQKQLEIKDRQISDLNARLAESHAAAQFAQQLHAGTIHTQLIDEQTDSVESDTPVVKTWESQSGLIEPKAGIGQRIKYLLNGKL